MPPVVSIIIPNWNGRQFLSRCLSAAVQSAQDSGLEWQCVVIDDASTDESPAIVERDFSSLVTLIKQPVNRGFGPTMNSAAASVSGDILVCLNNDLVAKSQLIRELVNPLLQDKSLFGVSGKTVNWGNSEPNHVSMAARWVDGRIELTHDDAPMVAPTMFLQGGCCSMRRNEFLSLGGFCDLFAPGYWEDYDISYSALKAGFRNLYNPAAQAYHFGGGSMGRALGDERLAIVKERNRHLFAMLNLTDTKFISSYLSRLPAQLALSRDPRLKVRIKALIKCAQSAQEIERIREKRRPVQIRSDETIFSEFVDHGRAN